MRRRTTSRSTRPGRPSLRRASSPGPTRTTRAARCAARKPANRSRLNPRRRRLPRERQRPTPRRPSSSYMCLGPMPLLRPPLPRQPLPSPFSRRSENATASRLLRPPPPCESHDLRLKPRPRSTPRPVRPMPSTSRRAMRVPLPRRTLSFLDGAGRPRSCLETRRREACLVVDGGEKVRPTTSDQSVVGPAGRSA